MILVVVIYLACAALAAAAVQYTRLWMQRKREWMERRLKGRAAQETPLLSFGRERLQPRVGATRIDRWFHGLVLESGVGLAAEVVFPLTVGAGMLAGTAMLMWRGDLLESFLASAIGVMFVVLYLVYLRYQRRLAAQEQLPDVMELLARAVRAGETIDQAIDLVGETTAKPLGAEFRRCARQLEMGLPVDTALSAIAERISISEMRMLAATLAVQRQTGGSLPITLERLSHVIRDRISYHRQFRAATSAGRISTILIGTAGPVVALYLLVWQRDYFNRFTETLAGQVMLATAIGLQLIGMLWIYLILRSDY
ncbi:MAG: type II secretion system F family protein [Planctomycetota bacterium]